MPRLSDIRKGQRFGRLVVIKPVRVAKGAKTIPGQLCQCDCGTTHRVSNYYLCSGVTKSCGCLKREQCAWFANSTLQHGHARKSGFSPTYSSYHAMLNRCFNSKQPSWKNYGGRGITVCKRWRKSFENFLADMGERPRNKTLDRIDNDGNYTPKNCQWATRKQQIKNSRHRQALQLSAYRRKMGALSRQRWKDPEYRQRMLVIMAKCVWKKPR